jgi:serine phosphatase RsbU (regulator of sigma subunit)
MRRLQSIVLIVCIFTPVFSQKEVFTFTENRYKAEYTLLLADYIEWPDSLSIEQYEFGVVGSEDIYDELCFKSETRPFKEKKFNVKYFRKINDIQPVNVLYIAKDINENIRKVWNKTRGWQVLFITDSCKQFDYIMINLLATKGRDVRHFEINKQNINAAGLNVSQRILYDGLREDEMRAEYRESGRQIEVIRKELETLNTELAAQYLELEQRIEEIDSLNHEITAQKLELGSLSADISLQQKSLAEKTAQLQEQQQGLNKLMKEINFQENQLMIQQDSIRSGVEILALQKDSIISQQTKINSQQTKISSQQTILGEQSVTIERQKYLIYFSLLLLVLVLAVVFFVIRAYRIKRSANRILRDKNAAIAKQNAEISRQKEEILAQREQLEIINKAIEKQNQDIKASIYYALTIQNAILPAHQEIVKYYDYFAIYLPKDIVAGDFYWFTNITRNNGEYSFFAVVDCTGHGVPGGFLSMVGSRLLSTIINENHIFNPDKILDRMDKDLRIALKQDHTEIDDGMDVCLCRLEKQKDSDGKANGKSKLIFSGAKRPLYILNEKGIEMIRGDRKTIGGRFNAEQEFTNREFIVKSGDRIYLTTDGITDQNSPDREKFGIDRFKEILTRTFRMQLDKQKQSLEEELIGFMKYEKQRDDITVLGVQI